MAIKLINGACSTTLWNTTKKALKHYEYLVFDPKYVETLEKELKVGTSVSSSFKNSYNVTHATAGGKNLFKRIWDSLKGIGQDYKRIGQITKSGRKLSFLKKLGPLAKRMPLIANLAFIAMAVPSVINAFSKGGAKEGGKEILVQAGQFGGFAAGAAIGQALIPIPFVGGLIGGVIGGWLASKVTGKSFDERQEEKVDATTGADKQVQAEVPEATTGADVTVPAAQTQNNQTAYNTQGFNPYAYGQSIPNFNPMAYSQGAYPQLGSNPFAGSDYMNEDLMAMGTFGRGQSYAR